MVRVEGFEPPYTTAPESKSGVSTSSTIPAFSNNNLRSIKDQELLGG